MEDYEKIISSLQYFKDFDLEWWTQPLMKIIRKIQAAIDGETDKNFWNSLFKYNESSGGPFFDGWITTFFPYFFSIQTMDSSVPQLEKNRLLVADKKGRFIGYKTSAFPSGFSSVLFVWIYLRMKFGMNF